MSQSMWRKKSPALSRAISDGQCVKGVKDSTTEDVNPGLAGAAATLLGELSCGPDGEIDRELRGHSSPIAGWFE